MELDSPRLVSELPSGKNRSQAQHKAGAALVRFVDGM